MGRLLAGSREIGLVALTCSFKRVLAIIGVEAFIKHYAERRLVVLGPIGP